MGERFFVEQQILTAVRGLLAGRVNEILGEMECAVPVIELGEYRGGSVVVPVVSLSTCERSEKERVIRLDAYALTIGFSLPETPESELYCYAYAAALERALGENPALGGAASRAVLSGKKYLAPKKPHCGDGWEVVLTLRLTVEGIAYAG
ncbi:MAG: hypothetical protein LBD18_03445 [Treponema sp.]|jgi:hypothetical protein|nr:hypothetical protein [Treponema sp.]